MSNLPVSEIVFKNVIERYPYLCASGLMTREYSEQDLPAFEADRKILRGELRGFRLAVDWMGRFHRSCAVSELSPRTDDLCDMLRRHLKMELSHGIVIAAALHLKMLHHREGQSSELRLGISKFCPTYRSLMLRKGA